MIPTPSLPSPFHPMPNLLSSAADEWLFNASDRDTRILTQALSICGTGPAPASSFSPSSQLPSPASYSSASPSYETVSRCLDVKPLQSQSFESLRTLQKQQQLQQQLNYLQQQKAPAMSSMLPRCRDGFARLEQISEQKGSPLSNNLYESSPPSSESAEAPASPFSTSTVSPSSAVSTIATESFLAHNPQNHNSQDGCFARESSRSSKVALISLASPASVGASGCKVNKRKNRANSKTPIAVLSADTSNFRALVQQLTGIPSSSSVQSLIHGGLPLVKPLPIRQPCTNTLNLPTLDTSACLLGPRNQESFSHAQTPHQQWVNSPANRSASAGVDLLRSEGDNGYYASALQKSMSQRARSSVFNDQASGIINQSFSSMVPTTSSWDSANSLKEPGSLPFRLAGEQICMEQSGLGLKPTILESLRMEEQSALKSSTSVVDSWLSFFEGAHGQQTAEMEIARMA